jgi:hypothetical protein
MNTYGKAGKYRVGYSETNILENNSGHYISQMACPGIIKIHGADLSFVS